MKHAKPYVCPVCELTYWIRATCMGGFDAAECMPPHRRTVTVPVSGEQPPGSRQVVTTDLPSDPAQG